MPLFNRCRYLKLYGVAMEYFVGFSSDVCVGTKLQIPLLAARAWANFGFQLASFQNHLQSQQSLTYICNLRLAMYICTRNFNVLYTLLLACVNFQAMFLRAERASQSRINLTLLR